MHSNLPPGVTDRDIEEQANGPACHGCGHPASEHYDGQLRPTDEAGAGCYAAGCRCEGFEEGGPTEPCAECERLEKERPGAIDESLYAPWEVERDAHRATHQ